VVWAVAHRRAVRSVPRKKKERAAKTTWAS
jgi:hypothetical protein